MIQKIISIKNVGRFRSCSAVGDVSFKKTSLIFAENGRGKTTLCAILRSLAFNNPAFVIGRTTLGSIDRPDINLLIAGSNITFQRGSWSTAYPNIEVFDGAYVSQNVFAGEVIDTEHRRNLYKVIIGAQGVSLAVRVDLTPLNWTLA